MLFKGLKVLLTSLTVVAVGGAGALAQTASPKIGVEYRAGLTYNNQGLEDYKGNTQDPSPTSSIALEHAKVTLSGEAAKDVTYDLKYNLLNSDLDVAMATLKYSDLVSFGLGKGKVHQGGYGQMYSGYSTVAAENAYNDQLPFSSYATMATFHLNVAGKLSLSFLDDVLGTFEKTTSTNTTGEEETMIETNGYKNSKAKGPAMTVQWQGEFNGWKPLVQIGSYDLNHSQYFGLGIEGMVAGLELIVDYIVDNRTFFARDTNGALVNEEAKDTLTAINLHVGYALSGFTPWLAINSYNNKQGTNADIATRVEEAKGNEAMSKEFADNALSYSLGVNCNAPGAGYEPFLAVVNQTGKFVDPTDASKEETLSNMSVKVGVFGKF